MPLLHCTPRQRSNHSSTGLKGWLEITFTCKGLTGSYFPIQRLTGSSHAKGQPGSYFPTQRGDCKVLSHATDWLDVTFPWKECLEVIFPCKRVDWIFHTYAKGWLGVTFPSKGFTGFSIPTQRVDWELLSHANDWLKIFPMHSYFSTHLTFMREPTICAALLSETEFYSWPTKAVCSIPLH